MAKLSTSNRFANNVKWQFIANGSQALFGGAYLIVLGRYLGPSEFGVFSIIAASISVATLLLEFRIQDVVAKNFCDVTEPLQRNQRYDLKLVDLLGLEIISRLIPIFFLVALAPWIAKKSNLPAESTSIIALAALSFLLSKVGTGVSTGLLRVLNRTDIIASIVSVDWGFRLLLTIILILLDSLSIVSTFWVALIVGVACNLTQIALAFSEYQKKIAALRFSEWKISEAFLRLRQDRRLLLSNLGVSASDVMAKDLDITLISSLMSPEKVGVYKMSKSFVQIIWRAIDPFYLAIMPEIQRLWMSHNLTDLKNLIFKTSIRLLILSLTLVLIGYIILRFAGHSILGPGYDQIPNLMIFMSIWLIVCAPLVWGHPLAVAINRPELALFGSLLGSVIGIGAFLILTPRYGLEGAAGSWVLTLITGFLFIATASLFAARKKLNQR